MDSDSLTRIRSLAAFIRDRRKAEESPYVLVLGAGTSLASGASSTTQIVDAVIREHKSLDPSGLALEDKMKAFYEVLDSVGENERYIIFEKHLKGAEASPGYCHLAALIKEQYFDLIITTNFDFFLENSLTNVGMKIGKEFSLLINGQAQEDQIIRELGYNHPRVKILKLHGDLSARRIFFTPEEIFQFSEKLKGKMADILGRDIIVIGHSLRDNDLNQCIKPDNGSLWYVNPDEPSIIDFAGIAIRVRKTSDHIISGKLGEFDEFFAQLYSELIKTKPKYTLNTNADPANGGTVDPINGTYDVNTSVPVKANANPGYRFVEWSGDASGNINPIAITMNRNRNIMAQFELETIDKLEINAELDGKPITGSVDADQCANGKCILKVIGKDENGQIVTKALPKVEWSCLYVGDNHTRILSKASNDHRAKTPSKGIGQDDSCLFKRTTAGIWKIRARPVGNNKIKPGEIELEVSQGKIIGYKIRLRADSNGKILDKKLRVPMQSKVIFGGIAWDECGNIGSIPDEIANTIRIELI